MPGKNSKSKFVNQKDESVCLPLKGSIDVKELKNITFEQYKDLQNNLKPGSDPESVMQASEISDLKQILEFTNKSPMSFE